jgi:CBS domain-containing protein
MENSECNQICKLASSDVASIAWNVERWRFTVGGTLVKDIVQKTRIVTLSENEIAIMAFHKMHKNRTSDVAVIDVSGGLVAVVSAESMRNAMMRQKSQEILFLPFHFFMLKQAEVKLLSVVVSVKASETLEKVVQKMVLFGVNRILIVNEDNAPIGAITAQDIMKYFI